MSDIYINEAAAHPLAKYRNHLEFNGYKVEEGSEMVIVSTHPRKPNLSLQHIPDRGVHVCTVYSLQPNTARGDLLEYINNLNSQFMYAKAYIDEDNELILENFYGGDYDRQNFSIFMENIEDDWGIFIQHERTEQYVN